MLDSVGALDKSIASWAERSSDDLIRYVGHVADDTIEHQDGSVLGVLELTGTPFHLEAADTRNSEFYRHVSALQNIGADNVVVYEHLVRHDIRTPAQAGQHLSAFAAELDAAYQSKVLAAEPMYENRWFLTVVIRPRSAAQRTARSLWAKWVGKGRVPTDAERSSLRGGSQSSRRRQLDGALRILTRAMRAYQPRRLGVREAGGFTFSEIAEYLQLILYARPEPVGVTEDGGFSGSIYSDRVICGRRGFHIARPGRHSFGLVHGYRHYPKRCRVGMFAPLLGFRGRLVLTNSFAFSTNTATEDSLALRERQMSNVGDAAETAAAELADARDAVASGDYVMGEHHWSLAVHADTMDDAERLSDDVRSTLSSVQMTLAVEGLISGEDAYYAQLPGNMGERTRPGLISSTNFARMSCLNDYPRGRTVDRWGQAVMRLVTTANTAYDHRQHVRDVGHMGLFGPNGSGKSLFMLFSLAMLDGRIRAAGGMQILLDKDSANEIGIRALGGRYVTLRRGQQGMAPLRRLPATEHTRAWLLEWLSGLVMSDGRGGLKPEAVEGLARGIAWVMRLAPEQRRIAGIREFLGSDPDGIGAGERLEQWCQGGARGWAFDGDEDRLDMDCGLVGIDPTELLQDEIVCPPMAAYLLHLMGLQMDGRPGAIWADEFKAYLADERFQGGFEDFALRLRKKGWFLAFATQQPEHMLGHPAGASILGQAKQFILFANEKANEDAYRGQPDPITGSRSGGLGCTPGEFRVIRQEMAAESAWSLLVKREPGGEGQSSENGQARSASVMCRFDLSPIAEYIPVLSGRTKTVELARKVIHELGDNPEVWLPEFSRRLATLEGFRA